VWAENGQDTRWKKMMKMKIKKAHRDGPLGARGFRPATTHEIQLGFVPYYSSQEGRTEIGELVLNERERMDGKEINRGLSFIIFISTMAKARKGNMWAENGQDTCWKKKMMMMKKAHRDGPLGARGFRPATAREF
jgi:hypothetical protein